MSATTGAVARPTTRTRLRLDRWLTRLGLLAFENPWLGGGRGLTPLSMKSTIFSAFMSTSAISRTTPPS